MKNFHSTRKIKLLILVAAALIINCKPLLKAEIDEDIALEPQVIEVQLTYNIQPTNDGKLEIVGETNLPEGTRLNVRMRGKTVVYDALSEIKVRDGQFRSAEFSLDKNELPLGEYWVTITMVLSTMQPPTVRQKIGRNGENLTGEIVRRYADSAATIVVGKHFILNGDGNITLINKPKTNSNTNLSTQ